MINDFKKAEKLIVVAGMFLNLMTNTVLIATKLIKVMLSSQKTMKKLRSQMLTIKEVLTQKIKQKNQRHTSR